MDKKDIKEEATKGLADQHIRPAGKESQKNPPKDWDDQDEALDESFPASDPPGNY